VISGLEHA
jgi:cystathionine beta-lyase/cystathionine gamma-synthase